MGGADAVTLGIVFQRLGKLTGVFAVANFRSRCFKAIKHPGRRPRRINKYRFARTSQPIKGRAEIIGTMETDLGAQMIKKAGGYFCRVEEKLNRPVGH